MLNVNFTSTKIKKFTFANGETVTNISPYELLSGRYVWFYCLKLQNYRKYVFKI